MFQVTTMDLDNIPKTETALLISHRLLRKEDKPYRKRTVKRRDLCQAFRNIYTFDRPSVQRIPTPPAMQRVLDDEPEIAR